MKRRLKCEDCGVVSSDVRKGVCPFMADVHDEDVPVTLCPSCFMDRADEI